MTMNMTTGAKDSSDAFSLKGRTILVTGASSGIGRSIAVEASRRGARLVLFGRDVQRLHETRAELNISDYEHLTISLDLTRVDEIEPALASILKQTGPISGFVHAAGIAPYTLLRDETPDSLEEVMRVNWRSFMMLCKTICHRGNYAPNLSVVAIASISATVGQTALSAYAASKGALISSMRSLASEYASRGIRFNCVSPAPVDTPMQDRARKQLGDDWYQKNVIDRAKLGKIAPMDVTLPVMFLLSNAARRITGQNFVIDGGWALD